MSILLSFHQIYPFADLSQCEKNIFLGEKNNFA